MIGSDDFLGGVELANLAKARGPVEGVAAAAFCPFQGSWGGGGGREPGLF